MSTALIDGITAALNNMKETAKPDQSMAASLDGLVDFCKEYQEKWLMSRNTRVNIYLYYAARNSALVASRIKERLFSNESQENSTIINELLQMMGLMKEMLDVVQNEKPDEEAAKSVIEKVKQLRAIAAGVKLVQPQEKELEDVDKLLTYLSKLRK